MLSNRQKCLLKQAQREADISDAVYRDMLETVSGVRTSTSPCVSDEHLDSLLKWFEALFWSRVDRGELESPKTALAVFRERGFWARKNTRNETSRDRYSLSEVRGKIAALETELSNLGKNQFYCAAIRRKVMPEAETVPALWRYHGALKRTLDAVQKKVGVATPF